MDIKLHKFSYTKILKQNARKFDPYKTQSHTITKQTISYNTIKDKHLSTGQLS